MPYTRRIFIRDGLGALSLIAMPSLSQIAAANTERFKITHAGSSHYVIAIAADAIPAEHTAAQELQANLRLVTGATLPIVNETSVKSDVPQILIGAGKRVRDLLPLQNWAALGHDGIVIKTIGNKIILAGGRPRGALYAVFTFLEEQAGCRWWTPDESTIPSIPSLSIPALNVVYVPPFAFREHFTNSVQQSPSFAAKMRENGTFLKQGEEFGGHLPILGLVHTFFRLLPPEKYFSAHPEWFSDPANGGKPSTAQTPTPLPGSQNWQPCLSNEAARQELTRNALQWLRDNPGTKVISISQNDGGQRCTCQADLALEQAEGSPSGPMIHFVNKIAEDIEKEFPGILVDTLAYSDTQKPPAHVKPRHNVSVRLCPIGADYAHPLDSVSNSAFYQDLQGWKQITSHLSIWDYTISFRNILFPHPNWNVLGPNLKLFAASGVDGVFEQGDAYSNGAGDFVQLRAWLMGRLLWNPQQDQQALMTEFLDGYYGPAGKHLKSYLDLLTSAYQKTGRTLSAFNDSSTYLTLDDINQCIALFNLAEKSVMGNASLAKRVRRARLTFNHVLILRYKALRQQSLAKKVPFNGPEDISAFVAQFISEAHEFGMRDFDEAYNGQGFGPYSAKLAASFAPSVPLPQFVLDAVPKDKLDLDVVDIQQNEFSLFREGELVSIVDDPAASDGKAARILGNSTEWVVQYRLNTIDNTFLGPETWRVYALMRIETVPNATPADNALTGGIYGGDHSLSQIIKQVGDFSAKTYQPIELGNHVLDFNSAPWVASLASPGVVALYVDRIIMVRQRNT